MVAKEFTRRTIALQSIPHIRISTGTARTARNLATVFGGISRELERQLDIDRQREGKRQGKAEAAAGTPVLKPDDTIFGQAFNDAAISTYATRVEIQARTRLVELEAEFKNQPAEFNKRTTGYIEGVAQEAKKISPELSLLFREKMGLLQKNATGRIFNNFIKIKQQEHEGTIRLLSNVLAHDLGIEAGALLKADDPEKQAEALATISAGMDQFNIALMERGVDGQLKINPKEGERLRIELRNSVLEKSIQAWFGSFDDRTDAAEQLISGKFKDENVQTVFELLDSKAQERVKSGLLRDESRLTQIARRQRDEIDAAVKVNDNKNVSDLLFKDAPLSEKMALFESLKHSDIPTATKIMLDKFIQSGGRFDGVDIQSNVLEVERKVRNGELKTAAEIIHEIANVGGVSLETMRQELIPLAEARQDKEFSAALAEGQALLGYDKSLAMAGLFPDRSTKAKLLEARMLRFKRLNDAKIRKGEPVDDIFKFMDKEVVILRKAINQQAASTIPAMAAKYRAALKSNKPTLIARAKTILTSILVDANYVDAATAASTGFDPIAAIDERAKRIGRE